MKKLFVLLLFVLPTVCMEAQLQLPPSGANQKSIVTQYMGAHASVSIKYNSPDVTSPQGESRRGKIWGQLVPYGLNNVNFGLSSDENPTPWRAGANENTIIKFSHDVEVQGQPVKAGKYGLHLIPAEEGPWTLILSTNYKAWGSYFYVPEDDALRAEVSPESSEYNEWLTYEFTDRQEEQCTVALKWEDLSIPFTIKLSNSKDIYVNYLQSKMENSAGFNWSMRNAAANYCLQNDVNLEQALTWQRATASNSFIGNENAQTLQTLAGLLMKLEKNDEAIEVITKAANHPTATVFQVHGMGRQLITLGYADEAMKVFKANMKNNGDVWPVRVGMMRGLSALGKYEKAIEHAMIAHERAPDKLNKDNLAMLIEKLKNGEDVN